MDQHAEMILNEYREQYANFHIIREIVLDKLKEFVAEFGIVVNSVEARIRMKDL